MLVRSYSACATFSMIGAASFVAKVLASFTPQATSGTSAVMVAATALLNNPMLRAIAGIEGASDVINVLPTSANAALSLGLDAANPAIAPVSSPKPGINAPMGPRIPLSCVVAIDAMMPASGASAGANSRTLSSVEPILDGSFSNTPTMVLQALVATIRSSIGPMTLARLSTASDTAPIIFTIDGENGLSMEAPNRAPAADRPPRAPVSVVRRPAMVPANAVVAPAAPVVPFMIPWVRASIPFSAGTIPSDTAFCISSALMPNELARIFSAGMPCCAKRCSVSPVMRPMDVASPRASTIVCTDCAEPPEAAAASPTARRMPGTF